MKLILSSTLFLSLFSAPLGAEVLTVGGPNGDYAQVHQAVSAASDGDTILVDWGNYNAIHINDKALTIMPRLPGDVVSIVQITVTNLALGKKVVLRGLRGGLLSASNSMGSIHVSNGTHFSGPAVNISNCGNVVLENCDISSSNTTAPALRSVNSSLAMYQCLVQGANGPHHSIPGGTGLVQSGLSLLFISKSIVQGGDGYHGFPCLGTCVGGDGGDGLISTDGTVRVLQTQVLGGAGGSGHHPGNPGSPGSGFFSTPGSARLLEVRGSILDTKPIVLTFQGLPGDVVEYAFSQTTWHDYNAGGVGPSLVDPNLGSGFLPAGTIQSNGLHTHTIHIGDIPPMGAEAYAIQGRLRDSVGTHYCTNSSMLTIFDECTGTVPIGNRYCSPAVPNGTGSPAELHAFGSDCAESNQMILIAAPIPYNQLGIFLTSTGQGSLPNPAGSNGTLCLGGGSHIGRYNLPGQIQTANRNVGAFGGYLLRLELDLTQTPAGRRGKSSRHGQPNLELSGLVPRRPFLELLGRHHHHLPLKSRDSGVPCQALPTTLAPCVRGHCNLQNVASVANLQLTTDALVSTALLKDERSAAGGGHGHAHQLLALRQGN